MEKRCSYDGEYTRKEAKDAGFCEDCTNSDCPYCQNCKNLHKNDRKIKDDFYLLNNGKKRENSGKKQRFSRKTYDEDD